MRASPPRRLPRHPRVWWSRIEYKWPFLVWAAALWAAFHLYTAGARTIRIPGVIEALREEAGKLAEMMAAGVEDAARLAYFRAEQQALAKSVDLYPAEIGILEREQAEARNRLETARGWFASAAGGSGGATNPPPAGLEAVAETVSLLRARRENFILRARHTGAVTRVWFQPGDVVAAGAPAITLLIRGEQRVTGFLGEHISHAVTEGQGVLVEPARLSGFAKLTPARIRTISPDVAWLPTRASPVQNQPIRGRRISVDLLEPIDLFPGEAVNIYVGRPWWVEAFETCVPATWRERLQRRSAFGRPTDTAR